MQYANNKGADQPAHPRNLISAFCFRCLHSIISVVAIFASSCLFLVSVAEQFESNLVANSEDRFSRDVAKMTSNYIGKCLSGNETLIPEGLLLIVLSFFSNR